MKILYTLPALDGGGIDRILYDYTIRFPENIHCDFLVHTDFEGILEEDLKDKGYNIYHVPPLHNDRKRYISDIKSIIKQGKYDIVHVNQGFKGLFFLYFAKKYKVKVRIAHAHTSNIPQSKKDYVIRKITTFFVKKLSTELFACGSIAAKWMWGDKAFNRGDIYIMKNSVDARRFTFSPQKRDIIRAEYNLTDKFVIGNVARISYPKNHEFLIDVFVDIKKQRQDAMLMLIGRGELEAEVKQQVEKLGLEDAVMFMGVRNDVADLLNAMDVFVLPSRYEGLPVTLVEIQANGLPAVISDTVTKEIAMSDNLSFLSLSQPTAYWANTISKKNRDDSINLIVNTAYDLQVGTEELMKKYSSILCE